ncbi:MAG: exopolyphosphatase [Micrococcales bacterium]|nr:exopolyphosphatase [Micrococcales bacterium]
MRVGAIDCGTNSIRLLVADMPPAETELSPGDGGSCETGRTRQGEPIRQDEPMREVLRRMEVVRLGKGIDDTGVIAPDSMARTLAMCAEYAAQSRELGVDRMRFVATSATRDAANAAEFITGVTTAFAAWGIGPEVVSGAQEAQLSFDGATAGLAADGIPGPYLIVDLGGGSTEFVRGDAAIEAGLSVDMGCVRFTERHLRSDPPTLAEIEAATTEIDAALDRVEAEVGLSEIASLVGLAGSVTTVTAYALGLPTYERDRIHRSVLAVADVIAACAGLLSMTRAERAQLGFMHSGRVDVIGAGALIWSRIVTRVSQCSGLSEVVTSEHDILDGIALSLR